MRKFQPRKYKVTIAVLSVVVVVVACALFLHTKSMQLRRLERQSKNDVAAIMAGRSYELTDEVGSCYSFGHPGDDGDPEGMSDKGRNCSYGFTIRSSVPKATIARLALAQGWRKTIINPGKSFETTEYDDKTGNCSISDYENTGGIEERTTQYFRIWCGSVYQDLLP